MKIIKLKIENEYGLHLRVASEVVDICRKHKSRVLVSCKECPKVDGCSILSLLTLGAGKGSELSVEAYGENAGKTVKEIEEILTNRKGSIQ